MTVRARIALSLVIGAVTVCGATSRISANEPHRFEIGASDFLLDGEPLQIRCGEMHFARVPHEYWRHRLKMIRAMGMNAVCAYLFWNYHEWNEGRFDWSGERDAAEFCRMAQEEGLWVILRPGPYVCAEWEMGGLPWWLLKHPGNSFLRTSDPAFVEPARRWIAEVGRVLAPLQVTHGGPILMVQVENEYGFYGNDTGYMETMRRAVIDAGFDVPLFACNPTDIVGKSQVPGLFSVVNFGKNPAAGFEAIRKVQATGPLMCGEFYPGWFDTWGAPHHLGDTPAILRDLDYMLAHNASFSLYMAHGGTTFGLWAGADRPFKPDTSSYDYDAPISEAGWATEKFRAIRATILPHLRDGETLPDPPEAPPVIAIPEFTLRGSSPVLDSFPNAAIQLESPEPIEELNISRGLVSYEATLPAGPAGWLVATSVRDLAWVFLDGRSVGVMDVRDGRFGVALPARAHDARVQILLYTIARVNFGKEIHDRKGVQGPVSFTTEAGDTSDVKHWAARAIDFGVDASLPKLSWRDGPAAAPAFWRGSFEVTSTGDTFLDVSRLGMGVVWVNGHCLGRYWNIGPTQTMYLPGPWLKTGTNEIVVLDLTVGTAPVLAGLKEPILDQLHPEKDLNKPTAVAEEVAQHYPNPLIVHRADPQVYKHSDGYYYLMGTVPEYDRLVMRRSKTIAGLATADEKVIWRKHDSGIMGAHIWAPEIHNINGKWFVYFAAGEAEHVWNIRTYVLENDSANPLEGEWIERGQIDTGWESFALDSTTFTNRGKRYLLWAQQQPGIKGNTNLYIAEMDSPTSIKKPAVMLSKPDLPWEQVRYWVNEAPAVLKKNGRLFLTYSAAGTGAEYCLGMLTASDDADLLDPKSWTKSPEPVFKTNEANGIFGPGHNCFTVAEDGVTDLLVYHARDYREIQGDPLRDPNRNTRVQPVRWRDDGTPDFGVPLAEHREDIRGNHE